MVRPLSIQLPDEDRQALAELALRQYRDPSDQAAYLIAEGLKRAGALPADDREPVRATRATGPLLGEQR